MACSRSEIAWTIFAVIGAGVIVYAILVGAPGMGPLL